MHGLVRLDLVTSFGFPLTRSTLTVRARFNNKECENLTQKVSNSLIKAVYWLSFAGKGIGSIKERSGNQGTGSNQYKEQVDHYYCTSLIFYL